MSRKERKKLLFLRRLASMCAWISKECHESGVAVSGWRSAWKLSVLGSLLLGDLDRVSGRDRTRPHSSARENKRWKVSEGSAAPHVPLAVSH